MIDSEGIYIGKFPDDDGYIGQGQNIRVRINREIYDAFNRHRGDLYDKIRSKGLKGVQMSFFTGPTYGIDPKLFNAFKEAMIGTINDLDIAEILYILKSQHKYPNLSVLNASMGGQGHIDEIKQSNDVSIPSLIRRNSSPAEFYNRVSMADIRQANINEFLERFYSVIFTENGNEFSSLLYKNKPDFRAEDEKMFEMSGPDFVNSYVIDHISIGTASSQGMAEVQSYLKTGVIDKMSAICYLLPDYLNQNKKGLNATARRDFAWAARNIYKELQNFDSDVSKEIRQALHKIIGSCLTGAKYVYTGQIGRGSTAKGLAENMFKRVKDNTSEIKKALQDALNNQIKLKLERTLLKAIRITNNKLKPDSTGGGLFEQGEPSFNGHTEEGFMKQRTLEVFSTKVNNVLRNRNILNRIDSRNYTYIDENFSLLETKHVRRYKKENNAIRMNFLPSEDQLYYAVREKYKDTKFYHSGFIFYRPLITLGRRNKGYHPFEELDTTYMTQFGEESERKGISSKEEGEGGYYLLYRSRHLLENTGNIAEIQDY